MAFRGDLDALILGVLASGAMHGYEITRRINEVGSAGGFTVREGQLYPILHRLESEGRIQAEWVPQEGKPARKVYLLTDSGSSALEAKRADWERFAASVSALLQSGPEVAHG